MGRVLRRTCWVLVCVLAACGDRRNTVSVDGALELTPDALDFQQVAVHDQRALPVTFRNYFLGLFNTGRQGLFH